MYHTCCCEYDTHVYVGTAVLVPFLRQLDLILVDGSSRRSIGGICYWVVPTFSQTRGRPPLSIHKSILFIRYVSTRSRCLVGHIALYTAVVEEMDSRDDVISTLSARCVLRDKLYTPSDT